MSPSELEEYLHGHIPLSRAIGVAVVSVGDAVVEISAPLAPNVNHRGTVFGGSAAAVGMLAAWALLHTRLSAAGHETGLVVRRSTMDYRAPITGNFVARASLVSPDAWPEFVARLERRGKARIDAQAVLEQNGRVAGELAGEFVALGARPSQAG